MKIQVYFPNPLCLRWLWNLKLFGAKLNGLSFESWREMLLN